MRKVLAWLSVGTTLGFAGASLAALFMGSSLGVPAAMVVWVGFGFLGLAVLLALVILLTAAIG
jgi:hypothetical protein